MSRVILSPFHRIAHNLAFESALIQTFPTDPFSLFWYNKTPCVVIGRHQNSLTEVKYTKVNKMYSNDIHVEYTDFINLLNNVGFESWKGISVENTSNQIRQCENTFIGDENITEKSSKISVISAVDLCRRHSGGGAVYQDEGCVIFSFLNNKSICDNFHLLKRAIDKITNVPIEISGRNDLLIDGHKFSGSAFFKNPKINETGTSSPLNLHHGTILINTNLSALSDILTPNASKLKAKGVSSVQGRVTNLFPKYIKNSNCAHIIQSILSEIPDTDTRPFTSEELSKLYINFTSALNELTSQDFLHGKNHDTQWINPRGIYIDGIGSISIGGLKIENNIITNLDVYSDSVDVNFPEFIRNILIGKSTLEMSNIKQELMVNNNNFTNESVDEFMELLFMNPSHS